IMVDLLYESESSFRLRQGQLEPGIDRRPGASRRTRGHDGAEALDGVLATDEVEGRQPRRCRVHDSCRDLEVGAGMRCEFHQQRVGEESRILPAIVRADRLSAATGGATEVCHGERVCGYGV